MIRIIAVAAALACAAGALAEERAPPAPAPVSNTAVGSQAVARAYMDAYQTIEWDRLAEFLADDAVWYDPSPRASMGGAILWEGRDAIVAGLADYRADTEVLAIDYGDAEIYSAGDATVFIGDVDARYPAADAGVVHWRSRIVTVVTVRDGKVVRHDDYLDYDNGRTLREAE